MSKNRHIQPISFKKDVWESLKKEAKNDDRDWSKMTCILISEALAARKAKAE